MTPATLQAFRLSSAVLVAHGIDVAVRLGRLADSSLGARFLRSNPGLLVASQS